MKAVVFDMDGLMFDTEAVFVKAWDWVGEKIGIGKAGFMVMETLGMNMELTKQKWRERFGDRCSEEEVTKLTFEYIDGFYAENKVPVKKGLHNLLEYLKKAGYRMAVASSSPMKDIERNLCDAGVRDYFSAIVSGDMVENSKFTRIFILRRANSFRRSRRNAMRLRIRRADLKRLWRRAVKP